MDVTLLPLKKRKLALVGIDDHRDLPVTAKKIPMNKQVIGGQEYAKPGMSVMPPDNSLVAKSRRDFIVSL